MGSNPPDSGPRGRIRPRCGPPAVRSRGAGARNYEGCEGVEVWECLQYGEVCSPALNDVMGLADASVPHRFIRPSTTPTPTESQPAL